MDITDFYSIWIRIVSGILYYLPEKFNSLARIMSARDALFVASKATRTFDNEESLPDLPVPDLKRTLQSYLESVRAVVTDDDEYEATEVIARNFENGIGDRLQDILVKRAENSKNWLEKWWEDVAYLKQRLPLLPYSNMSAAIPFFDFWPLRSGTRSERVALVLYSHMEFYQLMRKEQLKPVVNKGTLWSMSQFRRIFNTCRAPGEVKDTLISKFTTEIEDSNGIAPPTNVVVFYKGYIFSFDTLHEDDRSLLTPHEIKQQFDYIENWCNTEADGSGPAIGALTASDRTKWAQNRQYLLELSDKNRSLLDTIENSVMAITFDDREPTSQIEILENVYLKCVDDRWADKSLTDIAFRNGSFGANADHTPFDGLAIGTEYQYVFLSLHECAGVYKGPVLKRQLLPPKLLDFDIDDKIVHEISVAKQLYNLACSDIEVFHAVFNDYGRSVSAKHNMHPEAYIQVALQAAYYRTHQMSAPTYCTATTRKFFRGRTETCRTCFPESVSFARALSEGNTNSTELYDLLQRAAKKFQEVMSNACNGFGCDRHLLGLYLVAAENNINIPELFADPSFTKSGGNGNFVLSTSCAGYWKVCGSLPPMRADGYSFFYGIENHQYSFTLSAFKSSADTSCASLYQNLCATLADMKNIVDANV